MNGYGEQRVNGVSRVPKSAVERQPQLTISAGCGEGRRPGTDYGRARPNSSFTALLPRPMCVTWMGCHR